MHYIHLSKVSKYCFVEVGCINKKCLNTVITNKQTINMNMYIYKI